MKGIRRRVINMETIDVYPSIENCARHLGVSPSAVYTAIVTGRRTGGKRMGAGWRFEFFDYWREAYTAAEKERYSAKNGFFFFDMGAKNG